MKRSVCYLIAMAAAAFLLFTAASRGDSQAPAMLVIEGATLIDGNGGVPVPDSVIVISGNRIESVFRRGQAAYPAGARVLQAKGKFLVPGLMDAHNHYRDWMNEITPAYGVTSVFELGGGGKRALGLRKAINHGKLTGPRIFLAVGSVSGEMMAAVVGRATGKESDLASRRVANTPEEARETIRRFINAGADFLKVHRGPTFEVYQAAIDEGHKAGLAVVSQPLGPTVYAREAVLAGTDIIEHAAGVGYSIAKDPARWKGWGTLEAHSLDPSIWVDMDDEKAAEFIQLLLQRKVYLETDFICQGRGLFTGPDDRGKYESQDLRLLSNPDLAYIPERLRLHYLRNYHEFDDMDPAGQEQRRQGLRNFMRFIAMFVRAGGKVMAGTDSSRWAISGIGLHHELDLMVKAGLTPMQAIMAATRNVAEGYRVLDRLGTVEKGKLADMVLVNADPLKDINNLQKIEWVMKDGNLVDRTYHRRYKTPFTEEARETVSALAWVQALKAQTLQKDPTWAFGWPPLGIEAISPASVTEGDPTRTLTIKGVNFTVKTSAYVDGQPVPTRFVGETEVQATIDERLLSAATTLVVTVKHPEPLQREEWNNGTSNKAYLLVDYRY
jgi:hypothetical protein